MEERQRWQDGFLIVIGLWLAASPWLTSIVTHIDPPSEAAFWVFLFFGPLIAFFGMIGLATLTKAGEWVELFLGLGLSVSPHVMHFSQQPLFAWNAGLCAAFVLIFAISGLATRRPIQPNRGSMAT